MDLTRINLEIDDFDKERIGYRVIVDDYYLEEKIGFSPSELVFFSYYKPVNFYDSAKEAVIDLITQKIESLKNDYESLSFVLKQNLENNQE